MNRWMDESGKMDKSIRIIVVNTNVDKQYSYE